MAEPAYLRLPGSGADLVRRWSLWLGADHLLSVEASWFRERYRRFYYRDIQVIHVRQTRQHRVVATMFSVLFVLCGAGGTLVFLGDPFAIAMGVLLLVFGFFALLGLVVTLLRGPTAVVTLYTAVGPARLPSLGRVKTAERALGTIAHRIRTLQGDLPQGALEVAASATQPRQLGQAVELPAVPSFDPKDAAAGATARAALVAALFGHSFASGVLFVAPGRWVTGGWLVTALCLVLFSTLALAFTPRAPEGSRRIAGVALVYSLVVGFGAYVIQVGDQTVRQMSTLDPEFAGVAEAFRVSGAPARAALAVDAVLALALGLWAFLAELRQGTLPER